MLVNGKNMKKLNQDQSDKKKGKSTIINLVGYNNTYDYAVKLKKKDIEKT